ncbi:MAG: DUF2752 domain-containing protein [Phenylobacterium sp.]
MPLKPPPRTRDLAGYRTVLPGFPRAPGIDALFRAGLAPAVAAWALSLGTPVGVHAPGCLFRLLLDQDCWGCGTLRAMAALLRLDLAGAVALNPFSPLVAATLVAVSAGGLLELHALNRRHSHG